MEATGSQAPFVVDHVHDNDGTPFENLNYMVRPGVGENEGLELGPLFTEAEANIIAFALSAVASGHELQFVTADPDENGENVFVYEGPTEGVRAS